MESNKEKVNPEENKPDVKIDDLAPEDTQQDQIKGGTIKRNQDQISS